MVSKETPLPPLPPGKSRRNFEGNAISNRTKVESNLATSPPPPPPSPRPVLHNGTTNNNHRSVNLGKEVKGGKDNAVYTTKYSMLTFLPIAIREQFRRNGNVYFLFMGVLMYIGYKTPLYNTTINPWTTLGPLGVVMSISLIQEGMADLKRRSSDIETNCHPCVVLRRAEDVGPKNKRIQNIMDGDDVEVKLMPSIPRRPHRKSHSTNTRPETSFPSKANIAFASAKRMDLRVGEIILVRNREMVPADIIMLGSSGENGGAYVETSQIDGETNLKLRKSPRLPVDAIPISTPKLGQTDSYEHPKFESISQAVKRVTRLSFLGYPDGVSVLHDPSNASLARDDDAFRSPARRPSLMEMVSSMSMKTEIVDDDQPQITPSTKFIATLTSELPNASVNTFSGKITIPSANPESPRVDIPLNAENFLLRGAALRNTDWVIGVACFTGSDTKLVQNSVKTPSKFSRLDELMNRTVILILFIMLVLVIGLGCLYAKYHNDEFDNLWYIGYKAEGDALWPYLSDEFESPDWEVEPENVLQSILSYITLLNNFVPLSLYVTVEITTMFMMFLISWDKNMYHKETDTCAEARSTIVSDLGQIQYIFSDKTGTLTQNVMKFKRCSVDGMMFGAPVVKSAPTNSDVEFEGLAEQEFHPLKKLLVGLITLEQQGESDNFSLEVGSSEIEILKSDTFTGPEPLTFNAEMFLRVMSICHTVVVEKEMDPSGIGAKKGENDSVTSGTSLFGMLGLGLSRRPRTLTEDSVNSTFMPIRETSVSNDSPVDNEPPCNDTDSISSPIQSKDYNTVVTSGLKSVNGAPAGYTYQAESPDEEALVSAASMEYGFQLKSRDADGLTLSCEYPSLLSNKSLVDGLKKGSTTAKKLASQTASPQLSTVGLRSLRKTLTPCSEIDERSKSEETHRPDGMSFNLPGDETWDILAINKFDSTRKRMSVVVRSPPELGSIPMLLCKGADSAMLDPNVCGTIHPLSTSNKMTDNHTFGEDDDGSEWDSANILGIQAHLGAFASEGLRTLVLGIRILSEQECAEWIGKYERASASLVDRDLKLTNLAVDIEKDIHIVGTTAIEDKLQDGVPETISNIGKAGIKLWVLTGDKRETAIEIGYSTKVLDPTMNLTDVSDGSILKVRAQIAMEFMRLVKMGKLSPYQTAVLKKETDSPLGYMCRQIGDSFQAAWREYRRFYHRYIRNPCGVRSICGYKDQSDKALQNIREEEEAERDVHLLRTKVRLIVEKSIEDYRQSQEAIEARKAPSISNYLSSESSGAGKVFSRAYSAINQSMRHQNSKQELRSISIASMTSENMVESTTPEGIVDIDGKHIVDETSLTNIIDEDILSLQSFAPGTGEFKSYFNKKKRSILERIFAVDRDVRKGILVKHLTRQKKDELLTGFTDAPNNSPGELPISINEDQRRALVIEGSALAHFLGDPLYEEMLFAVASCCESVIACRVSPKQKALLVKMVQDFVKPSPVTLAIGDGANDVGMIQEAHVGVGISGLEGKQAVNASDFSIAQFRFLEELLLVHGRWNFIRLSKVILFSFYKNALLAALLICYSPKAFYSGLPLFDQWCLSSFNFICSWPILLLGFFDRDLDREYVKRYPHLYAAGPANESLCLRVTLRWVFLVFLHSTIIFFFSDGMLGPVGASMSSAFKGLMANESIHGDGEGGNLKVYGTVMFVALNWILALKVLFESSSIIHGVWPAFTCQKKVGEGFWNRVAYTWHGVIFLSIAFTFFFLYTYQTIGRDTVAEGFTTMAAFVCVTWHMFHTRSITWIVLLLTPISAVVADVVLKVFSNTYYPTQTQIHKERQWQERQQQESKICNDNKVLLIESQANVT